jgi:predicted AlkP superfamily pyrophosphatase or phosphodiesterase
MQKTVVINVVGLTNRLIGQHTPYIAQWRSHGQQITIKPQLPALTCTAQATYLTGKPPTEHGIVANGWYFHDDCEIKFWRQSNPLVQSPKLWDVAKKADPSFTCANLFWWYNMYSTVDYAVTPRPMYPADGRKLPDIHTHPATLRDQLQSELGQFPLFKFWGPATSIESTAWIAQAAKQIEARHSPTLTLIYLPHLDYCLQKIGCDANQIATDLQQIDQVCAELIDYYQSRNTQVIILSEYGVTPVSQPIHLNRLFREKGWLSLRTELGHELLDAGASQVFAVADHQIAHIYLNPPPGHSKAALKERVQSLLTSTTGVAEVLDTDSKRRYGLDHPRSGDLIAIANPEAWFTYYYWLNDQNAPDFARTVDIHRKPGYDPVELFTNPQLKWPLLKIGKTLLKKKLGFRYLMDVIPLDATLVKGSHGHIPQSTQDWPLLITQSPAFLPTEKLSAGTLSSTDVFQVLLNHLHATPIAQTITQAQR